MIELLSILLQIFLFIFITIFPLNKITTPTIYTSLKNCIYTCIGANILIMFLIFLFFSFFNLNQKIILYFIFFFNFFLLIISKKNISYFNELKKIKFKNYTLLIFFIFFNLIIFVDIAENLKLGWDGIAIWLPKANNFYNNENYFNLFKEDIAFKQYPHLGSYIWSFFWKNSLLGKEYLGRLFFNYIYIVALFVLANSINFIDNFKKIVVIFCLILLSQDYDYILGGYQDYLLFSLLIFSAKFIHIYHCDKYNNNCIFLLLILVSMILPWIKNEGVLYSLFLIIIICSLNLNLKLKFLFALVCIVNISVQSFIVKYIFKINQTFQISLENIVIFFHNFDIIEITLKVLTITFFYLHGVLKYPICIIYILSLIFIFKDKIINEEIRPFLIFLILNIAFMYGVYLLTPFDLIWHLQTSIKRLILQTSGFYIFLSVLILNNKKLFS